MIIIFSCSPKFHHVKVIHRLKAVNSTIRNPECVCDTADTLMLVTVSTKMSKDVSLHLNQTAAWSKTDKHREIVAEIISASKQSRCSDCDHGAAVVHIA